MRRQPERDAEKEWQEKLFGECEDEFCETFGVYDGKFEPHTKTLSFSLSVSPVSNVAVFASQQMIFFLLMTMRKTLGTGPIVLEENISIKRMPKLKDLQRHLRDGKRRRRVKKTESKKSKPTKSCTKDFRKNMRSIWHAQHVRRKRLARAGSAGMRKSVQLLSMLALQRAAPS